MATEVSLRFSRSTRRLWPILPVQTAGGAAFWITESRGRR